MRPLLFAASTIALLAIAGAASAQPSAANIVKRWDTNKDGVVDRAEWVAAGRPAQRFDMVDANKDGKITVEELAAALAARPKLGGK